MMTSSTLTRPGRINNEEFKVSKKSKTLKKKMSIKKQKVLRSNAFRVVSQLTRKKLMFKKENNELPSTSSENNNEAANDNGNLLNLLQVKDTQLKKAHTMVKECLEKTMEAERKAEKVSALELEVLKLKRELAETRSRDYSMLNAQCINESLESSEAERNSNITHDDRQDTSFMTKNTPPFSCSSKLNLEGKFSIKTPKKNTRDHGSKDESIPLQNIRPVTRSSALSEEKRFSTPVPLKQNRDGKDEIFQPKRPVSCSSDFLNTSERGKMFLLNASFSMDRLRKTCLKAGKNRPSLKKS